MATAVVASCTASLGHAVAWRKLLEVFGPALDLPGLPRKWRTIGFLAILGGILTAGSKAKSGRLRADPRRWEPHRRVFERVPRTSAEPSRTDRRYIQGPL